MHRKIRFFFRRPHRKIRFFFRRGIDITISMERGGQNFADMHVRIQGGGQRRKKRQGRKKKGEKRGKLL